MTTSGDADFGGSGGRGPHERAWRGALPPEPRPPPLPRLIRAVLSRSNLPAAALPCPDPQAVALPRPYSPAVALPVPSRHDARER